MTRRALTILLLTAGVLFAAAAPLGAQPGPTTATPATAAPPAPGPPPFNPPPMLDRAVSDGRSASGRVVGPSDDLGDVPVTSPRFDASLAARDRARRDLDRILATVGTLEARIARLDADGAALDAEAARLEARASRAEAVRDRLGGAVRELAVARFTGDDATMDALDPRASATRLTDGARGRTLGRYALEDTSARLALVRAEAAEARLGAASRRAAREESASRRAGLATELERARATVRANTARFFGAQVELARARVDSTVVGSDLSLIALDAYWRASKAMRFAAPECRLTWSALAGVGRAESRHGASGGNGPYADGTLARPVRGVALDGSGGTRAIGDTDGGALDGDPQYDRAVGPMQFLPGTWRRFGADLSGDGVADPQNLYDSAYAAARYLCRSGPLDTDDGLRRAFFAYNRSAAYVERVLGDARGYEALPVPSVPFPASE